jgi:hypothetical protein
MSALRRHRISSGIVLSLLAVLFIGTFHGIFPAQAGLLSGAVLAGLVGSGFWSDPCTWDGFGAGIGLGACALGSIGACGGAIYSIWRAIKVDNCFS